VNDMTTGNPAVGATITIHHDNSRHMTDENGIVLISQDLSDSSFHILTAEGLEITVFANNGGGALWSRRWWGDGWGSPERNENYWSVVQLDRTLFQRSDTLNFWGFVEHRDETREINYVTATITRSSHWWDEFSGDLLHSHVVPVHQGSFSGEISLPYLDPGSYLISVSHNDAGIGSVFFTVNDYVTPPYRMTVTADKQAVFLGDTINFDIRTEFFEGTPVAQLDVSYSFNGHELLESGHGRSTTDDDGSLTVSTGSLTASSQTAQGVTWMSLYAEATFPEVGSTWVHSNVVVLINDIDVSAYASKTGGDANINIDVNSVTVDRINDGTAVNSFDYLDSPVSGQSLSVDVYRIYWVQTRIGERYDNITRQVVPRYRFDRREERIDSFNLTTDINGQATRDFTVPDEERESYIARVRTSDGNGRAIMHEVWVGADFSRFFWNIEDGAVFLELDRDDGLYDIGENVEVTVMHGDAPISSGKTLFVLASRGIIQYYIGTNSFGFTFDEHLMPNATVYAFYFNGHTYHSGWEMRQWVEFDTETRLLNVEVMPDRETFLPGEMATVIEEQQM